jgi:hypothetical protein
MNGQIGRMIHMTIKPTVEFCDLPTTIGGRCWSDGLIQVNSNIHRPWSKGAIIVMIHELTHHITNIIRGDGPRNAYQCYKDELIAYRMQWIAETLLGVGHPWNSVEDAAWMSVIDYIGHDSRMWEGLLR